MFPEFADHLKSSDVVTLTMCHSTLYLQTSVSAAETFSERGRESTLYKFPLNANIL
jgi:hypothetical protein